MAMNCPELVQANATNVIPIIFVYKTLLFTILGGCKGLTLSSPKNCSIRRTELKV
jgi:hypothetical protein